MGVNLEEDLKRKMVELNLNAARKAQSPQTGYIHLHYEAEDRHDTIPIFENLCFVLALFRSKISDNVIVAKTLLEKLLVFEVDGNFPIYLHEYPECKDRDLSLNLLPVFHWILTDFATALGQILSNRLEVLIGRILSHGYKMHQRRPLCKGAEFRLKSYFQPSAAPPWVPAEPHEWADALISWQMAHSRGICLENILEQALEKWHPQLCTFIGPQQQDRGEPKATLLDLMMGHYHGTYSLRALKDHRVHLLASLIQPFEKKCLDSQKEVPCHAIALDTEHPYTLYWGNPDALHSLYLDPQKAQCAAQRNGNTVEFTLALPPKAHADSQDAIELSLFFNLAPLPQTLVNGVKATTFQLGDRIDIHAEDFNCRLEILAEKGEGKFFGHLLRANRPNQRGRNLKYATYDWQIALRTICRTQECALKVIITL